LRLYAQLSLQVAEESDIVIWPETAIPILYQDAEDFIRALEIRSRRSDTDYLVGVPSGSWDTRVFYNGVISFGSSHGFYYKRRLLPFGEYLPLRSLLNFFHRFVEIPMADFTPGSENQALLKAAGHPVGVSICFEAAFGSEIRKDLPRAQFLVNVSNDAWFGDSLAPYQHLQIVRMRALETGRYMARATNTGITALIDERGRITVSGKPFSTTVVQGKLQPMTGATPYVRMGDSFTVVLLGTLLTAGLILGRIRGV
jgi:apolipoprotein N-acyltransferase